MVFQYPWTSEAKNAKCLTCGTVRGHVHNPSCVKMYKEAGISLEQ